MPGGRPDQRRAWRQAHEYGSIAQVPTESARASPNARSSSSSPAVLAGLDRADVSKPLWLRSTSQDEREKKPLGRTPRARQRDRWWHGAPPGPPDEPPKRREQRRRVALRMDGASAGAVRAPTRRRCRALPGLLRNRALIVTDVLSRAPVASCAG